MFWFVVYSKLGDVVKFNVDPIVVVVILILFDDVPINCGVNPDDPF
jgi:hypothetical protein